eukprot:TRINITY_DN14825_c0_g2_i2.p1 TRINITY_DN14825_c0_g2~~TRINITY_DN14825_c0_g2_i2.p1  ORF type:complete len:1415 (+),score=358.78 TRINITY_DN14825_c0_g2_i2:46-4245(+)
MPMPALFSWALPGLPTAPASKNAEGSPQSVTFFTSIPEQLRAAEELGALAGPHCSPKRSVGGRRFLSPRPRPPRLSPEPPGPHGRRLSSSPDGSSRWATSPNQAVVAKRRLESPRCPKTVRHVQPSADASDSDSTPPLPVWRGTDPPNVPITTDLLLAVSPLSTQPHAWRRTASGSPPPSPPPAGARSPCTIPAPEPCPGRGPGAGTSWRPPRRSPVLAALTLRRTTEAAVRRGCWARLQLWTCCRRSLRRLASVREAAAQQRRARAGMLCRLLMRHTALSLYPRVWNVLSHRAIAGLLQRLRRTAGAAAATCASAADTSRLRLHLALWTAWQRQQRTVRLHLIAQRQHLHAVATDERSRVLKCAAAVHASVNVQLLRRRLFARWRLCFAARKRIYWSQICLLRVEACTAAARGAATVLRTQYWRRLRLYAARRRQRARCCEALQRASGTALRERAYRRLQLATELRPYQAGLDQRCRLVQLMDNRQERALQLWAWGLLRKAVEVRARRAAASGWLTLAEATGRQGLLEAEAAARQAPEELGARVSRCRAEVLAGTWRQTLDEAEMRCEVLTEEVEARRAAERWWQTAQAGTRAEAARQVLLEAEARGGVLADEADARREAEEWVRLQQLREVVAQRDGGALQRELLERERAAAETRRLRSFEEAQAQHEMQALGARRLLQREIAEAEARRLAERTEAGAWLQLHVLALVSEAEARLRVQLGSGEDRCREQMVLAEVDGRDALRRTETERQLQLLAAAETEARHHSRCVVEAAQLVRAKQTAAAALHRWPDLALARRGYDTLASYRRLRCLQKRAAAAVCAAGARGRMRVAFAAMQQHAQLRNARADGLQLLRTVCADAARERQERRTRTCVWRARAAGAAESAKRRLLRERYDALRQHSACRRLSRSVNRRWRVVAALRRHAELSAGRRRAADVLAAWCSRSQLRRGYDALLRLRTGRRLRHAAESLCSSAQARVLRRRFNLLAAAARSRRARQHTMQRARELVAALLMQTQSGVRRCFWRLLRLRAERRRRSVAARRLQAAAAVLCAGNERRLAAVALRRLRAARDLRCIQRQAATHLSAAVRRNALAAAWRALGSYARAKVRRRGVLAAAGAAVSAGSRRRLAAVYYSRLRRHRDVCCQHRRRATAVRRCEAIQQRAADDLIQDCFAALAQNVNAAQGQQRLERTADCLRALVRVQQYGSAFSRLWRFSLRGRMRAASAGRMRAAWAAGGESGMHAAVRKECWWRLCMQRSMRAMERERVAWAVRVDSAEKSAQVTACTRFAYLTDWPAHDEALLARAWRRFLLFYAAGLRTDVRALKQANRVTTKVYERWHQQVDGEVRLRKKRMVSVFERTIANRWRLAILLHWRARTRRPKSRPAPRLTVGPRRRADATAGGE